MALLDCPGAFNSPITKNLTFSQLSDTMVHQVGDCSAIGNLDHCLNQVCAILTLSLEAVSDGEPNKEHSRPSFLGSSLKTTIISLLLSPERKH